MIALVFEASLLAVLIGSFLAGGRPERLVALSYAAAAIASEFLRSATAGRYHHPESGVMAVDVLLLATLTSLSLLFECWWLPGAAALQLVTVLGHVAKLLKPEIWPLAYAWMMQASSFPSLALLAIGIATSRKRVPPRGG